jgi:hypothetical protein
MAHHEIQALADVTPAPVTLQDQLCTLEQQCRLRGVFLGRGCGSNLAHVTRGIGASLRKQSSTRVTFWGWVESHFAALGHDQVTLRLALMQGPGRPEHWAPMRPIGACLLGPAKGPKDALRSRPRLNCGGRLPKS